MRFLAHCWAVLAAASITVSASAQVYSNPVLDQEFADPTVIRVGSTTYAYATGDRAGSNSATPYILMSKSADLVHWSATTTVMPLPAWATGATWAPHVVRDTASAHRYVMYFSAKADSTLPNVPDDADKCLGVAVARSPEGPFHPQKNPLICGPRFRNIDPMAFHDTVAGKWFLYWGSEFQPIRKQELSTDLLTFAPGSEPIDVIDPIAGDKYSNLIEGTWVIDHGSYRYIFLSGSDCCEGDDRYAVTVARKPLSDLEGPWERYKGGDHGAILKMNASWGAPGHNAIFVDGAQDYWIAYHARRRASAKRVFLIDRIDWRDGWPRIAGDGPSTTMVKAPTP